jgi:hypothetical protein
MRRDLESGSRPGPNQVSVAVQTLYDGDRATLAQDAKD